MSAKSLALKLAKHAWQTITWREGTNNVLRSRFARVQVRTAPIRRAAERPEETLLNHNGSSPGSAGEAAKV